MRINILVKEVFEKKGWHREAIDGLRPAMLMGDAVTPLFFYDIKERSGGCFVIEGYCGIIDRAFEKKWNTDLSEGKIVELNYKNNFAILINTLNIENPSVSRYLKSGDEYDDLVKHCDELFSFFEYFPRSRDDLRNCFVCNRIGNLQLNNYVMFGQKRKYEEMKNFIMA